MQFPKHKTFFNLIKYSTVCLQSTGICFIGKRNFKNFIEEFVEQKPGKFIDIDTGLVVANHKGFDHFWFQIK